MALQIPAPTSDVAAIFTPALELRPLSLHPKADGLFLCHLSIGVFIFPERTFFASGSWSADSRYFAATEAGGYSAPPRNLSVDTFLTVIDVTQGLEVTVAKQTRGVLSASGFEGNVLVFTRELDRARGFRYIREITITDFKTWRPVRRTS